MAHKYIKWSINIAKYGNVFLSKFKIYFAIFKGVGNIGKTKFRLWFIVIYLVNLSLKYSKITNLDLK